MDLFDHLLDAYMSQEPQPAASTEILDFITHSRQTLRENQPVGAGPGVDTSFMLTMQDGTQLALVMDEAAVMQESSPTVAITQPRDVKLKSTFDKQI